MIRRHFIHTVAGMAVSMQANCLLPLVQNWLGLYNHIAYHDYAGAAGCGQEVMDRYARASRVTPSSICSGEAKLYANLMWLAGGQ